MKIVTTEKRGVFFGEIVEQTKEKVVLKNAQMCVYWSADVRGVLGLAATGPSDTCRITKAIPNIELYGITSVMDCTEEAAKKWKECPWG